MTRLQTLGGGAFDLLDPLSRDVSLPVIAESLAKIARFHGHSAGAPYSVAQHCVLGAAQMKPRSGSSARSRNSKIMPGAASSISFKEP